MNIVNNLEALPPISLPCGLTIGNFDGMHRGHQYLFKTLRSAIGPRGTLAVLTFNNHPAEVLPNRPQTPLLCPISYKFKLFEKAGADLVIALDFTKECAETPYDNFVKKLKQKLSFSYLLLGKGARFGKNREGDETRISLLAQELGFQSIYLDKYRLNDEIISSDQIRKALEKGDLNKVQAFLGRPYTLYGRLQEDFLDTQGLCLPPEGIYPILVRTNTNKEFSAKAHITDRVRIQCESNLLTCIIEAIFL